jgi:hypothetical protein
VNLANNNPLPPKSPRLVQENKLRGKVQAIEDEMETMREDVDEVKGTLARIKQALYVIAGAAAGELVGLKEIVTALLAP